MGDGEPATAAAAESMRCLDDGSLEAIALSCKDVQVLFKLQRSCKRVRGLCSGPVFFARWILRNADDPIGFVLGLVADQREGARAVLDAVLAGCRTDPALATARLAIAAASSLHGIVRCVGFSPPADDAAAAWLLSCVPPPPAGHEPGPHDDAWNEALCDAASMGDVRALGLLVSAMGRDAAAALLLRGRAGRQYEYLRGPLHEAARTGHVPAIDALLRAAGPGIVKVRIHCYLKHHDCPGTALEVAILHGRLPAVERLLQAMQPWEAAYESSDLSPLQLAAWSGSIPVLDCVLAALGPHRAARMFGERPDDDDNWSVLHCAVMSKDVRMVDHVLRVVGRGADCYRRGRYDDDGLHSASPLHFAACWGYLDILERLLEATDERAGAYMASDSGLLPIHYAAENGHEAVVRRLLDAMGPDGAAVQAEGGMTPLHFAAEQGSRGVVQLLLDRLGDAKHEALLLRAERGARDSDGGAPLHYAAYGESTSMADVAQLLLDHMHARDLAVGDESTALHVAADHDNAGFAAVLLAHARKAGGDVLVKKLATARDCRGRTPLHVAADRFYAKVEFVAAVLCEHPGAAKVRCDRGRTPLHVALWQYDDGGSPPNEGVPSWNLKASASATMVKALLAHMAPADVTAPDGSGRTALHMAALAGHIEAARAVLKAAGPQAARKRDQDGRTPLDYAVQQPGCDPALLDLLAFA